jgi:amino acid adenylation domain-containing protein
VGSPAAPLEVVIAELAEKGITLWVEGDQLRIRAPKRSLSAAVRDLLAERKPELIQLLRQYGAAAAEPLPRIVPAPQDRYLPFPLNEIQQAYWVGRTAGVELGNITTHAYMEMESSHIDSERLAVALRKLVDRHDMLRAIVLPSGEQCILEHVPPYRIAVTDLEGQTEEEIAAHIETVRGEMSHQMIALEQWPLFEIRATRMNRGVVRIHFSIDLIITDFGSLLVLIKEWGQFYRDPDGALPPLEISFRDFVLTDLKIQETERYRRSERYWLDRLDRLPPRPQLPLARNPGAIQKPHFVRRKFVLETATWRRLRDRAQQDELTPSGILLAAFAEALTVWSQSPQFTINLTQYNRLPLHPQVNDIIGNSISVILLAVDNSLEDTFLDRAKRVQAQLWRDLNHTYFSGVKALRELARRQRHSQGAIMPVVFTSILGLESFGKTVQGGEFAELVYTVSQTPQVWLDHQVLERRGELVTSWDAVEDLFPEGLLDSLFAAYTNFLVDLASGEEPWHRAAPRMTPAAHIARREAVNLVPALLPSGLLHSPLEEHARTRPEAAAVIASDRTLTYAELFSMANRLGRILRAKGARPNQPIAVVADKGWEQVVAVMGILTAGAPYMPVDPQLPAERLAYLLEQAGTDFVLTQSRFDAVTPWPAGIDRLAVDRCDLSGHDASPLAPVQTAEDLAYVIFTSGSTGNPKGAMLEHRGPLNMVAHINQRFGIGASDRALALSALNFDLSVYDLFGMLAAGGALVMPDAEHVKDPAHWASLMVAHRVTFWNSVPTLMKMVVEYLASHPGQTPPGLRTVILSGDWIPVDLPGRISALWSGVHVISAGGPTETSVWNICQPIESVDPSWTSIPYGRAIVNNAYHVMDGRLQHRPDWVPGELMAEGVGLARGYWRDPETTAAKFLIHPESGRRLYRTGDLGRYRPDGTIEILGRVDFQVKINGYRIELGEIEAALRSHSGVADAVVGAVGSHRENLRLVAYVVPADRSLAASDVPSMPAAVEPEEPIPGATGDMAGVLLDPIQWVEFKLAQAGLRRFRPENAGVQLPRREFDEERARAFAARHSVRQFRAEPVPLDQLSRFLECLEQMPRADAPIPKRAYPSAGSLYPVQAYLHVKPGRVDGLEGGTYYYDPAGHRLFPLEPGSLIASDVHVKTNRELFEQSGLSVFLVGKLGAIEPIYGRKLAREFAMLEAGYMGQALMLSAAQHGLGMCPIGAVNFDALRARFHLDEDHVLLHSLVAGLEAEEERRTQPRAARQAFLDDLRKYAVQKLPSYMVPASYVLLEAMPLNANRKVDRRALAGLDVAASAESAEVLLPQTDLERTLAEAVKELLHLDSVSLNSNFFDLGANSVHLVQLHSKLTAALGRSIPIVELFRHPTITFLARYLAEGETQDTAFEQLQREAEKRRMERNKRRQSRAQQRR